MFIVRKVWQVNVKAN